MSNTSNVTSLTTGEMYCGPGGIALGAKDAAFTHEGHRYEFRHKWATDWDSDTCDTYSENFGEDVKVVHKDIRELDIDKLPSVDGFMYGFPCNDFSLVGETKGLNGKFGPLYSYGVQYINRHNPLFFLAENVSGISSANSGSAFEKIKYELENAGEHGYTLTSHLYKFEKYGVPQARHRYIVIGIRKDLELTYKVPAPSGELETCKEAIEKPPIPEEFPDHEFTKQSRQVVERLKHIKPGENAWNAELPDHLKLNVKGAKLSHIYKRLDPDKPSYTITGSGGGGTHVYHWSENRALTNRERARLQTFPDHFVFEGGKESVRKQIGMAVPPRGAKVILKAVLQTLHKIPYDSVEESDPS